MIETDNYYRRRIEEELAAAARSEDPSISHIHLEMARRYREMLSSEADRANGASAIAQQASAAQPGTIYD